LGPFVYLTALEKAEIISGKGSDTRKKLLAFTSGHRYIAVTPERTPTSVGEFPLNIYMAVKFLAVSL
jgi:hypothetical protein